MLPACSCPPLRLAALFLTRIFCMQSWNAMFGRTALSIAIIAGSVFAFTLMRAPEVPKSKTHVPPGPLVETQLAVSHSDGISFDVDGVVVPFRQLQLAAEVSGKVQYKSDHCRTGKTVNAGDLLLQIEPDDYQLEVRRLEQELAQAVAMTKELDAEITSSENQIKNSEQQLNIDSRQLARNSDLQARGAASVSEVDDARRSELVARTSLQSIIDQKNVLTQRKIRLEAAKAFVQANLEKAELSLRRTQIIAPFDAVVVSETVEQDSYVQPGTTVVVLQETTSLDVSCKLHMRQMNWLWQGAQRKSGQQAYEFPQTPATVIYELAGQKFCWNAVVDRYDGAGIDNQTRMISCRVHVSEPTEVMSYEEYKKNDRRKIQPTADPSLAIDGDKQTDGKRNASPPRPNLTETPTAKAVNSSPPPTLMTGMFVEVHIHANPPVPLIRIPQEAIQPGKKVWVVKKGSLIKKQLNIALSTEKYVVALQQPGGLTAGDEVIVSPLARPTHGMKVYTDPEAHARAIASSKPKGDWSAKGGN